MARLAWPVEANEVFAIAPQEQITRWQQAGIGFCYWPISDILEEKILLKETLVRFVASFNATQEELAQFEAAVSAD